MVVAESETAGSEASMLLVCCAVLAAGTDAEAGAGAVVGFEAEAIPISTLV